MSESIITVEKLSKRYRIGERERGYKTFREAIIDVFAGPVRNFKHLRKLTIFDDKQTSHSILNSVMNVGKATQDDVIWALKNVSFEIRQGEIVGIIGRNGAGKSTLLKILSRITEPTAGDIKIHGRVSSLLEVGTGFHPELTGRENVFLNGAILGMRKKEIERKFNEIVEFAEIDKFVDTPIKYYSSGMYVRLAFAVAAHLEPEILLVDEVLAVGDAGFQKKCLRKMGDVAKEGRTVLFVSHNMTAIRSLCMRAIWLDKGMIAEAGEVRRVVDNYLQTEISSVLEQTWISPAMAPGNDMVRLHHVSVTPLNQERTEPITVGTSLQLNAAFWNHLPDAVFNFSIVLYSLEGVAIFNTGSPPQPFPEGLICGSFVIPGNFLNDGTYTIRLLIVRDTSVVLLDINNVVVFEVHDSERKGNWYGKWIGVVRPKFDWIMKVDK